MKDNERFSAPSNARQGLGVVVPIRPSAPGAKRPDVDWDRVEAQYRAGILTLREIGSEHGISHNSVDKRAKTRGWVRDLTARINAQAQALVERAQVDTMGDRQTRLATEREIVTASAMARAAVEIRHRTDLSAGAGLVASMMRELRSACEHGAALQSRVIDLMADGHIEEVKVKRLIEAIERSVSLPVRSGVMKTLTDCLTKLIASEREAWGMNDPGSASPQPVRAPDMATIAPEDAARTYLDWASNPAS